MILFQLLYLRDFISTTVFTWFYLNYCIYVILFQLLYLRDFLGTGIPVFMELLDMWFSTKWRIEKDFFILSNLKAIDFGSKAFI
jgi:hypothetical protein